MCYGEGAVVRTSLGHRSKRVFSESERSKEGSRQGLWAQMSVDGGGIKVRQFASYWFRTRQICSREGEGRGAFVASDFVDALNLQHTQ